MEMLGVGVHPAGDTVPEGDLEAPKRGTCGEEANLGLFSANLSILNPSFQRANIGPV